MLKKTITTAFAAAALTAVLASPAAAVGVNLIGNGGFEADVGLSGNDWDVFNAIPGPWTTYSGRGIEIQRGSIGGADPYEGFQKVELDSHNLSGDGQPSNDLSNSGMSQSLALGPGTYEFSFAYLGRTDDAGTNGIGFSVIDQGPPVDQALIGGVTGVRADEWQVFSYKFTLDELSNVNVNFWANGDEDTNGGNLDDVSLSAVPLPAALPLYGAGLAALGFMGWRRKRKAAAAAA